MIESGGVVYVETGPLASLAAYPRAVYRITLARQGVQSLAMAAGIVSWPDVVESVVDAIARSPYGIPLGYTPPAARDAVAVIDVRAKSFPGASDSVGQLVTAADAGSVYARVARIERMAPVPAAGSAEEAERKRALEAEAARAADAERERSILSRVGGILSGAGTTLAIAVIVAAGVAVYVLTKPTARALGKVGDSGVWE